MNLQPKQFTDLVFTLKRSFHSKYKFEGSPTSLNWVDMHHAKPIPVADLQKPFKEVFYLPMYSVVKNTALLPRFKLCLTPLQNPSPE